MIRTTPSVCGLAVVSILSMLGCAAKNGRGSDDGTGAAGDDVAQVESDTESFGSLFASEGSDGSLAPSTFAGGELTTQGNGTTADLAKLSPAGCATVAADAANKTSTYTFADCTGPYGFVHIKGTVTVTWEVVSPTELKLTYASTDFSINRATITSWNATADISANGAERDMQWSGHFTGTTGSGRAFERTNTKDVKWNAAEGCIAIDGQSTGSVTGKNLTTKIITYSRCLGSCPEANSEIDIHNDDNGNDVDIVYQGGAKANVTLTSGARSYSVDINLACGG